jgi:hypothetical protein
MLRQITTVLAVMALLFAGLTLAEARGASHDIGMDVVICSGVGMTTISIGPDGQPVKQTEPCPDGTSIFAASFTLPALVEPEPRLLSVVHPLRRVACSDREELSPTARGPPALA